VQDEFSADVALLKLPDDVNDLLETQFEYPLANDKAAAPGILLHGKPGCGKTSIAERIAVNGNAAYLQLKVSKLLSHLMGDSEAQLAAYVQACIDYTGPIVLLLDEIDGPFNKFPTENERTLVTCFKETVSVKTLEENRVVVVATSNKVQDMLNRNWGNTVFRAVAGVSVGTLRKSVEQCAFTEHLGRNDCVPRDGGAGAAYAAPK
jgi:SpoVK/Ycf46/Vps4 family AAA+-type ATPase